MFDRKENCSFSLSELEGRKESLGSWIVFIVCFRGVHYQFSKDVLAGLFIFPWMVDLVVRCNPFAIRVDDSDTLSAAMHDGLE